MAALAANPFARAIGLALVEFIWQGAAVGLSTALVLVALRRASAHARYVVACVGLLTMPVMLVATVGDHMRASPVPSVPEAAVIVRLPGVGRHTAALAASSGAGFRALSSAWIEPVLPYLVMVWSGGVFALALQLLSGWARVGRVGRRAVPLVTGRWPRAVRAASDRMGLARSVQLLESTLVDVPAAIGWLRPVIVVPASALAGLPPAQLEAILAHELAHIRRGDYLINLVQCVIELLLFYHPAVWWVSGQVRLERENCCDDIAVSVCRDRVTYARALMSLEELRGRTQTLAMAASGGQLLSRIRRLVEPGFVSGPRLSGGFAMGVVLTVLLLAMSNRFAVVPAAADRAHAVVAESPAPPAAAAPTSRLEIRPAVPTSKATRARATVMSPALQRTFSNVSLMLAQEPPGKVAGTVRDEQGGVIPGADIALGSSGTSDSRRVVTNGRGQFSVDLASGVYSVTVSMPGFRTTTGRVQVTSNGTATVNIRLQIGSTAESITVTRPVLSSSPSASSSTASYAAAYAAAVGDSTAPVRVGGDISPPRKIRDVAPIYPADAATAGVEGTVRLDAVIAADGSVRDVRIVTGAPMLDDAAATAVRQWQYTPTLLNGRPVELVMMVTITFVAQ